MHLRPGGRKLLLHSICVLAAGLAYLLTLTPGHAIAQDDFAGYIMHAANLVEGRPYAAIHYIANPHALRLAPPNGYPPVYPLLLAPAYKAWGINFRAFKAVTILCFVVFLAIFSTLSGKDSSTSIGGATMLLLACNPVPWELHDYLLSEFPYLMFTFASLLVAEHVYAGLKAHEFRVGSAFLLSLLLYASYGTRTIGIALLPGLVLADLLKFRRPSRFLLVVLALTAALILAQTVLLTAPKGYLMALELSAHTVARNALFYSKTLSYVWANGLNKMAQIVFALLFTALAVAGFVRRLWAERSLREFYLLGYLAILFVWPAQLGLRGLLPILPLYFAYGLAEFQGILATLAPRARAIAAALLLLFVGATYAGELRKRSQEPPQANVNDAAPQELFAFLRTHTGPLEVLLFINPRALALYTNRSVGTLAPAEPPEDSSQFVKSVNATVLVEPVSSPPEWEALLASNKIRAFEIFHNSQYSVFRIALNEGRQPSLPVASPAVVPNEP
jgi:hypothetical protein